RGIAVRCARLLWGRAHLPRRRGLLTESFSPPMGEDFCELDEAATCASFGEVARGDTEVPAQVAHSHRVGERGECCRVVVTVADESEALATPRGVAAGTAKVPKRARRFVGSLERIVQMHARAGRPGASPVSELLGSLDGLL